ncbi:MAG: hypothetical protein ABJA82_10095 [Myxococcales bacterium]
MDVVLSVTADGWDKWGEKFVKRQPHSRVQQTIGPHPTADQTKTAILRAIATAGSGGRVIINVGHGAGGGQLQPTQGSFELAPGGAMRIVGRDVQGGFVDVFYDVNLTGPPSVSDLDNDLKNNPQSARLARFRMYQQISQAFKNAHLREVVLLTCRVGSATEFLRKVANDWGVVVRSYRQRVELTEDITTVGRQATHRFFMHLQSHPPAGKPAHELIVMEEEIPFAPGDTFLVGPPLTP